MLLPSLSDHFDDNINACKDLMQKMKYGTYDLYVCGMNIARDQPEWIPTWVHTICDRFKDLKIENLSMDDTLRSFKKIMEGIPIYKYPSLYAVIDNTIQYVFNINNHSEIDSTLVFLPYSLINTPNVPIEKIDCTKSIEISELSKSAIYNGLITTTGEKKKHWMQCWMHVLTNDIMLKIYGHHTHDRQNNVVPNENLQHLQWIRKTWDHDHELRMYVIDKLLAALNNDKSDHAFGQFCLGVVLYLSKERSLKELHTNVETQVDAKVVLPILLMRDYPSINLKNLLSWIDASRAMMESLSITPHLDEMLVSVGLSQAPQEITLSEFPAQNYAL